VPVNENPPWLRCQGSSITLTSSPWHASRRVVVLNTHSRKTDLRARAKALDDNRCLRGALRQKARSVARRPRSRYTLTYVIADAIVRYKVPPSVALCGCTLQYGLSYGLIWMLARRAVGPLETA
jgi:hypothetical protein